MKNKMQVVVPPEAEVLKSTKQLLQDIVSTQQSNFGRLPEVYGKEIFTSSAETAERILKFIGKLERIWQVGGQEGSSAEVELEHDNSEQLELQFETEGTQGVGSEEK